jgi:xylan 1,4-beta-xylosidase
MQGVRYHGMYDDDMNVIVPNLTSETLNVTAKTRSPAYSFNFSFIEQSWDYQHALGMSPIVELSFMPAIFANCSWGGLNKGLPACKTMMAYKGISQPPVRMSDWQALVKATAEHAVKRYGVEAVRKWKWEVSAVIC